ncbi:MAG: polysaccharide biosynthesis C-terminal domain-containing protein [Flavobacteriales bacterium]
MGIVQKDAIRTSIISFVGLILGYLNKGFLFVLLFSRAQVGLVNLVMNVALLFAQFANFGTIYSTWRFFPFFRNKDRKHFGFLLANLLVVCIGITLFSLIIFLLKDTIVKNYQENSHLFVDYYYMVIPLGISIVLFQLFENHMRGMHENVLPVFLQDVVLRLLTSLLLLGTFVNWFTFPQFFIAYVALHFLAPIYLFVYLWRKKELHFSIKSIQISNRFQKIIFSYTSFSYLNSLAALVVVSMDSLMIAKYNGLSDTGVYTTTLLLISAVIFPYRSVIRVSSPLISKQWKERNMTGMKELYQKSSSIGLLLGLLGFLGVWLPIKEIFSFIPGYEKGIWVFFFLMMGRIVDMYFGLNGIILSTSKKYKSDFAFTLMLIICVYAFNLYLIPKYGIVGAAISTGFVYILYNLLRGWYIARAYQLKPFQFVQAKLILAFAIFIGAYYCLIYLLNDFSFIHAKWMIILLKEFILLIGFIFPIYWLNLEPESTGYIRSLLKRFTK